MADKAHDMPDIKLEEMEKRFTHSWWYSDTIEKHWYVFSLCVPPDYDLSKLPNFSISSGHNRPTLPDS